MKSCNCAPDSKYKHLLSPINVGGLWLRNRMMTTSMSPGLGYTDCVTHMPTQMFLNYLEERAAGGFDLILCGKQTTDGDTAQVGPEVAEWLHIPSVSNVRRIDRTEETGIVVEMEMPEELEIARVAFPCLLAVEQDPDIEGLVIILNTVKGYGSPVMEDKAAWHHHLPNDEEYAQIIVDFAAHKEAING